MSVQCDKCGYNNNEKNIKCDNCNSILDRTPPQKTERVIEKFNYIYPEKCPNCGSDITPLMDKCDGCGTIIEPKSIKRQSISDKLYYMDFNTVFGCGFLLAITLLFIFIIGVSLSKSSEKKIRDLNKSSSNLESTNYSIKSKGEKITLPGVILGTTKNNINEITKYAVNGDSEGILELVYFDKAFVVEDGTTARIIDSTISLYQVRIFSGDQRGRTGWIPKELAE